MRAERNAAAKAIAEAKQRGDDTSIPIARQAQLKAQQTDDEARLAEVEARIGEVMLRIPNLPDPTAADGMAEEDAVTLRTHGEKPEFGFPAKDHLELAGPDGLGLIEVEAAARVSGSRFHYLLGDLVRLEFALVQWGMAKLVGHGFVPVIPPVLVREAAMEGTGFFPEAREQVYASRQDELFLVGTAEVPLAALHGDEMLDRATCPCATSASRPASAARPARPARHPRHLPRAPVRQAGDVRSTCPSTRARARPAACDRGGDHARRWAALPRAEHLGRRPGRARGQEVRHRGVAAGAGRYRELTSMLELHRLPGPPARHPLPRERGRRRVHMLNGTAITSSRTLLAVIEYGQQADGSIRVPEPLHALARRP